jgi:hypothetical protein
LEAWCFVDGWQVVFFQPNENTPITFHFVTILHERWYFIEYAPVVISNGVVLFVRGMCIFLAHCELDVSRLQATRLVREKCVYQMGMHQISAILNSEVAELNVKILIHTLNKYINLILSITRKRNTQHSVHAAMADK